MTTAHRPTFDPARGKEALRGPAYHQRLLPAHTHLKVRQQGQGGAADAAPRDLRAELLKAEATVKARKVGAITADADEDDETATGEKRKAIADRTSEADANEDAETKRRRLILEEAAEVDADDESDEAEDDEDDVDDSDEDDEDEEAELQRELAKIKAERAAKKAAEDAEREKEEADKRMVDIARGNPLLNSQDFNVKRRWDDDVVFKNQGRGTEDREKRKEFVNDLLRSDFHKRFMSKYVR